MMLSSPSPPSSSPGDLNNITESINNNNIAAEKAEQEHEFDAQAAFTLNLTIIACLLLAYAVRKFRIYSLPESAGALLVGVFIGGIARCTTDRLELFEFSPEVFFFFLLPPIIFEAGYSLDRKGFFDNIGAITLYAMFGTIISTFVVGYLCYYAARIGLVSDIDDENPMEALLFGALISAVDPVATLSIMGNEELNVDPLLYSLVFGESVLNDAIAICLFKTFYGFYINPETSSSSSSSSNDGNNGSSISTVILYFVVVSGVSILVGVGLGLGASWLYKHTDLKRYPKLETSLLLCFCYLCYATAESIKLSGIMAIFFQGVTLSHYNAYNLSRRAHVASEQIFSTFATLTETIVFVYMGMGVFTGRFQQFDPTFSAVALVACLVGRALNIVPLSWLANLCRKGRSKITPQMQMVLWFAGLRGAIAFALSENMPGPHKDVYATATLTICIVTTVFCGGFTERMLAVFGMKEEPTPRLFTNSDGGDDGGGGDADDADGVRNLNSLTYKPPKPRMRETVLMERRRRLQEGIKGAWNRFDDRVLKPHFGGDMTNVSGGSEPGSTSSRPGGGNKKEHDSMPDFGSDDDHEGGDGIASQHWSASTGRQYEMSFIRNGNGMGASAAAPSDNSDEDDQEMVSLVSRNEGR
jgi:solute carrier family 9 (sodium/hydrogen exchanger), member 8